MSDLPRGWRQGPGVSVFRCELGFTDAVAHREGDRWIARSFLGGRELQVSAGSMLDAIQRLELAEYGPRDDAEDDMQREIDKILAGDFNND